MTHHIAFDHSCRQSVPRGVYSLQSSMLIQDLARDLARDAYSNSSAWNTEPAWIKTFDEGEFVYNPWLRPCAARPEPPVDLPLPIKLLQPTSFHGGSQHATSKPADPGPVTIDGVQSKVAGKQLRPQVRKRKDFESMFKDYRGAITSLMIRNIPCRIAQEQLAVVVDSVGFKGKYDYLFVPTGSRPSKIGISNLGYAFINLPDARDAADFAASFTDYKFAGCPSLKKIVVRPAHVQGSSGDSAPLVDESGCTFEAGRRFAQTKRVDASRHHMPPAPQHQPFAVGLHTKNSISKWSF